MKRIVHGGLAVFLLTVAACGPRQVEVRTAPTQATQIARNTDGVRNVVDPMKLKMPVFGGLFQKIPYRSGDVLECCAPMFHSFGYAQLMLSAVLGQTIVVRRYFDDQLFRDSNQHDSSGSGTKHRCRAQAERSDGFL